LIRVLKVNGTIRFSLYSENDSIGNIIAILISLNIEITSVEFMNGHFPTIDRHEEFSLIVTGIKKEI